MPFVKLDCGILDSSLWIERAQREIFITSLLMAEPYVLDKAAPQFKVRSLEPTGWVIPPGRYGFVRAAGVGIVRRAGVDSDPGLDALEKLGSQDPDSRSEDFDGRRLVRVDGGYIVLNYFKYRDYDYTAAERQQRYRDKQKVSRDDNVTGVTSRRNVTDADADADAEGFKIPTSPQEPTPEAPGDAGVPDELELEQSDGPPDKSKRAPNCPHEQIIHLWHEILPELPRVLQWSAAHRSNLNARWKEKESRQDIRYWRKLFAYIKASPFLTGQVKPREEGKAPFVAKLRWVVKSENFIKIIEGDYHRE